MKATAESGFRRLAIGDQRLLGSAREVDEATLRQHRLDARTEALLRIAALVALDAPSSSFRTEVDDALRAGARLDDLLAVLVGLSDLVGSARVVSAAPRVALAAGYDVDAALEATDLVESPT